MIVSAGAALLDIVFSNFIVNALKYGKDWIVFSARREGESWIIGVGNGGAPIPGEKIPLLFQKFSRLVGSSDGAGLGLYLVRRIAERHDGSVWCESETPAGAPSEGEAGGGSAAGSGTRFFLKLPVDREAQVGTA